MAKVWAKVLSGDSPSAKNVHIQVNGYVEPREVIDWDCLLRSSDVQAQTLRLDAVNYALAEGTEVLLAWDKEAGDGEQHVFLPLNGRGRLDFDSVNGLRNTVGEGKNGDVLIYVSTKLDHRAHFTFTLDFSKQGA